MKPLPAVVLAAGASTRLGETVKQLAKFQGDTLVRRTVRTAVEAGLAPVLVVVGCAEQAVSAAVSDLECEVVSNPRWGEGQSTSVKAGLAALPDDADGVVFVPCDQPLLDVRTLRTLVGAFRETGAPAVVPGFEGRRGAPVVIARDLFSQVAGITGDEGARQILARHGDRIVVVELDREGPLVDVDWPEDLERLAGRVQ